MSFYNEIQACSWEEMQRQIYKKSPKDVERALQNRGKANPEDFMALVSPAASEYLEEMAQLSQQLTLQRFGKTIQLYIPLYLSNECTNGCVYCGFNHQNKVARKTLTPDEVQKEANKIKAMGFEHLLLVTGEHPKKAGFSYLNDTIQKLSGQFSMVSIEVQPMETIRCTIRQAKNQTFDTAWKHPTEWEMLISTKSDWGYYWAWKTGG